MKKMSVFDEKNMKYAFLGESTYKGIFMRMEGGERNVALNEVSAIRFPGAYAYLTEDGNIEVDPENIKEIKEEIGKENDKFVNETKKLRYAFCVLSVFCFIGMILLAFVHEYLSTLSCALMLIFLGLARIANMVNLFIKGISGNPDYMQCFRFHAAEHAAINAYYDLKRVPTMEEIKNYSNYSYRCGTVTNFKDACFTLGVGLCRLAPDIWLFPLLIAFLFFYICWASKKNFFFAEVFSLAEPTDFEYDAAIRAMTRAVEKKEEVEREFKDMFAEVPHISIIMGIYESKEGAVFSIQFGNPEDLEDDLINDLLK